MSPLSQSRLLVPLLEAIRKHLCYNEYAAFRRTTHGSPYIEVRTERGSMTAGVNEDGLYTLDAAGSRYTCNVNDTKGTVYDTIRQALNDTREEWA